MKKLLFWLSYALSAAPAVQYHLSFPNAAHHEAEIQATFSAVIQPELVVWMSRSSPGRYALHEFAKNVYHFQAFDAAGHALPITRSDPYSWKISGHQGTVIVKYTLFGDHADGTYAGIDETHAHLNPPAALVWAHGFEASPVALSFDLPARWRVGTQLAPQTDGTWTAPNLALLMDAPIELSAHTVAEWRAADQRIQVVLHHNGTLEDAKSYAKFCQAIVAEEAGVFGGLPRFDNGAYFFLTDYLPYAFGDGMEHRNSTSITGTEDIRTSGKSIANTAAHEFFHAWNVRRIRPKSLEPFDFERADMSGELWFAEGFTSYYGPLAMRRAGLSTNEEFLHSLTRAVNAVINNPGRHVFSPVEMSDLAPFVDAARPVDATNFPNTFISYYTYGAALAFGIDLSIREQFPGKSLDDWMRTMWRHHPDADRPYTLSDLEDTLAETTGDQAFAHALFERHILGREPLDYAGLCAKIGLHLRKVHPGKPWLGPEQFTTTGAGLTLSSPTLQGTPLYTAGLDQGDEILRCDGKELKKPEDFSNCIARRASGDIISLDTKTRAGSKTLSVVLAVDPSVEIVTYEISGLKLSEQMKTIRDSWLASKAAPELLGTTVEVR